MKSKHLRVHNLITAAAAGAATLAWTTYRKEMEAARRRIENGRQLLESPLGSIEFAECGDGPAILVIHGAGGGFDQALHIGSVFLDDKHRLIAPSRFGYLGTPLPDDASAEAQADAHLRVLDALKLDRVPVIAISAGAPSAMQFCLRHPHRCSSLILAVPLAYPVKDVAADPPPRWFGAVLAALTSSDALFWAATKVARPALLNTILGTSAAHYRNGSDADRMIVDLTLRHMLPISRRAAGIRNDSLVASNLARYPLEELRLPTLVIGAVDCLYGTYPGSLYTAEHVALARLLVFASGGHLLLGHAREVRSEIIGFLREHAWEQRERAVAG